jgi:hypothetical protein
VSAFYCWLAGPIAEGDEDRLSAALAPSRSPSATEEVNMGPFTGRSNTALSDGPGYSSVASPNTAAASKNSFMGRFMSWISPSPAGSSSNSSPRLDNSRAGIGRSRFDLPHALKAALGSNTSQGDEADDVYMMEQYVQMPAPPMISNHRASIANAGTYGAGESVIEQAMKSPLSLKIMISAGSVGVFQVSASANIRILVRTYIV